MSMCSISRFEAWAVLMNLNACSDGRKLVVQSHHEDFMTFWRNCDRGSEMSWLLMNLLNQGSYYHRGITSCIASALYTITLDEDYICDRKLQETVAASIKTFIDQQEIHKMMKFAPARMSYEGFWNTQVLSVADLDSHEKVIYGTVISLDYDSDIATIRRPCDQKIYRKITDIWVYPSNYMMRHYAMEADGRVDLPDELRKLSKHKEKALEDEDVNAPD